MLWVSVTPLDGELALASHWVVVELLWMLGLFALGLGIIIWLVIFREPAEPAEEPVQLTWGSFAFRFAYGCFRVIVYLIIIFAVVVGLAMLFAVIGEWIDG